MRRIFIGEHGVRAGWRLLGYLALTIAIGMVLGRASDLVVPLDEHEAWSPRFFLIAETVGGLGILATLLGALVVARLERRSVGTYGLPLAGVRAGTRLLEGTAWGLGAVGAMVLLVVVMGGSQVRGLALPPGDALRSGAAWALAMLALGFAEEFLFRGYILVALTEGMGFWPAAAVTTAVFTALHYLGKPMETPMDALNLALIASLMCLSIRLTGSLWYAVGFHAGFDWAAMPLFAAPNTGNGGRPVVGHLLDVAWTGPAWMTGGPCGLEASVAATLVFTAAMVALWFRFRPSPR